MHLKVMKPTFSSALFRTNHDCDAPPRARRSDLPSLQMAMVDAGDFAAHVRSSCTSRVGATVLAGAVLSTSTRAHRCSAIACTCSGRAYFHPPCAASHNTVGRPWGLPVAGDVHCMTRSSISRREARDCKDRPRVAPHPIIGARIASFPALSLFLSRSERGSI